MKKFSFLIVLIFLISFYNLFADKNLSLYEQGLENFKKKQYNFAVTSFQQFIDDNPESVNLPQAIHYQALSYYYLLDYNASLKTFKNLKLHFSYSSQALYADFWSGLIYQNQNDWQNAFLSFSRFINKTTDSTFLPKALLAIGNISIKLEKYNEAEDYLTKLFTDFNINNIDEKAIMLYSYCLLKNEKYTECIELLKGIIPKIKDNPDKYEFGQNLYFYYAESHRILDNPEIAREYYKRLLFEYPMNKIGDIALLRLYVLARDQENANERQEYFSQLENQYPRSPYLIYIWMNEGINLFTNNDYIKASFYFQKALALKKNMDKTKITKDLKQNLENCQYYLAEIELKTGNSKRAFELYQNLAKESEFIKDNINIRLVQLAINQNNLQQAKEILTISLKEISDPKILDELHYYRAYIFLRENKYTEGIAEFSKISPDSEILKRMQNLQGEAFLLQKDYQQALSIFEKNLFNNLDSDERTATELNIIKTNYYLSDYQTVINKGNEFLADLVNSTSPEKNYYETYARYLMGLSYLNIKQYKKGINVLKNAKFQQTNQDLIEINNEIQYYLAWLYYKDGQNEKASELFLQISKLSQSEYKDISYYMAGWTLFTAKKYNECISIFEKIIIENYSATLVNKAEFQIAKAYWNLGNKNKALAVYKKIFTENKESIYADDALYEYGLEMLKQNKIKEGLKSISQLENNYPASPLLVKALFAEGETFYNTGRHSEAFNAFEYLLQKYPRNPEMDLTLYYAAQSAVETGLGKKAIDYLTELLNAFPDSGFKKDAVLKIAEISFSEKNYQTAKEYYTILSKEKADYYKEKANKKLKEIDLLISGNSKEEVRLKLIIDEEKKSQSNKYYEAAIQLNEIYLNDGTPEQKKQAVNELNKISKQKNDFYGGKAKFLLAKQDLNAEKWREAAFGFRDVIQQYKGIQPLTAESLYYAALALYKAEYNKDSKLFIKKLKETFPKSEWTDKANDLETQIPD